MFGIDPEPDPSGPTGRPDGNRQPDNPRRRPRPPGPSRPLAAPHRRSAFGVGGPGPRLVLVSLTGPAFRAVYEPRRRRRPGHPVGKGSGKSNHPDLGRHCDGKEHSVWFRVLGPLEVIGADGPLSFAPRQRTVLAMLLLDPNRLVTIERLVDAVWDTAPPSPALEQIRSCVSAIRRPLAAGGRSGAIVTRPPGYSIQCTDRDLDLLAFNHLVASGRRGLGNGRPDDAAGAFRDALRLWHGTIPLVGVRSQLVQSIGSQLAERRLAVVEEHIDVRLRLGRYHELVNELVELVTANPFRERLRARLMIALYRTGRQVEALHTYRLGRQLFVEELGLEPGAELRRLERAILAGETADVLESEEAARPLPYRRGWLCDACQQPASAPSAVAGEI